MSVTKTAHASIKALTPTEAEPDLAEGEFEALVSVFGNVDSYGDVVMPGAFTDSLDAWTAKGGVLPTVWSHRWDDPFAIIGGADPAKARETDDGLVVRSVVDLDNPLAAQVYRLLKEGKVAQFSFGFEILDAGWGTRKADDGSEREVFELRKLDLIEVGPCLRGVNTDTTLLSIKGRAPHETTPERKGEPGHAAPSITRDSLEAWAFINDLEGVTS